MHTRFLIQVCWTGLLLMGIGTSMQALPPQRSLDKEKLTEQGQQGAYEYGLEPLPEESVDAGEGLGQKVWKILLYGSVAVALTAIIVLVLRRTVSFRTNPSLLTEDGLNITQTDIRELDTATLLHKAKAEGNYRLGVRLLFLDRLKTLTQQGLIDWQPYKTNYDYLQELGQHRTAEAFQELTRAYEYVWYGEFALSGAQFEALEKQFGAFSIKS